MGNFSGKTTNWKQIGGNDRKIVIIGREIGTGTRFVFEDKVAKTLIPIKVAKNACRGQRRSRTPPAR